jgi:Protein of unknown function (DUF3108)
MTRLRYLIAICALFLITHVIVGASMASDAPFHPGEKLEFELRWGLIPAGKVVMEVLPLETIDGVPVYHFVLTAKSNSFLDVFYKVRDRIDSYTDTNLSRTLFYKKKQREGNTKRDITVHFDWENNKVQYTDGNKTKPPVSVEPGAFDPLAVFYYSRLMDLDTQTELQCPVTDGKKCIIGRAKIVKRETIRVGAGEFDTFLLEPELKHIRGVFEKSTNAKIRLWITADDRRIPVKIQSKVAVGSFVGELVKARIPKFSIPKTANYKSQIQTVN